MNIPQLRFSEFKGEWETKKLGDITFKTDKKNKKKEILPVYSISNKFGFIPQSEQFEGVDSIDRGYDTSLYKIIENNTFSYNPARINVGSIGYNENLGRVIVSSLYVCFQTKENINDSFLFHFFNTTKFNNSVLTNGEGGVRIYLFYENFSSIPFSLPSLPEQKKIASFITAIDKKISELKQKKNLLEQYKKGVMQKLFSQELRFKDENGKEFPKWEKKKFDEIFLFSIGRNIKQKEASPEFETPCVRYGELYHLYAEVIKEVINKTNLDKSELLFSEGDEILLPSAGEDPMDIGSASALTISNVAIGRTINILKPKRANAYSQIFVAYYINQVLKKRISTLAKGVSISNVYNSDLKTLEINLPSFTEQIKIASFLSAIDEKINRTENQLQQTQQYKKGLLQKMFI